MMIGGIEYSGVTIAFFLVFAAIIFLMEFKKFPLNKSKYGHFGIVLWVVVFTSYAYITKPLEVTTGGSWIYVVIALGMGIFVGIYHYIKIKKLEAKAVKSES